MVNFRKALLLVSTAATAVMTAASVHAQTAPASDTTQQKAVALDEIIVVARRREENVQSVPVAVTAVTGKAIERAGVTSVALLGQQTPALVIAPTTSRATPAFAIRGQRQQDYLPTVDQSVAVYFGDLYLSRQFGVDQALFDVQSVDVLRGPQGTLFGRNSTGGAIIIRPVAPTDRLEGYAAGTVGDYDRRQFEAVVNLPLAKDLALRLGGMTFRRDGYVTNVLTGDDVDNEKYSALRASLKFSPAGGFESTTVANYFDSDGGGTPFILSDVSPSNTSPVRQLGLEAPLRALLAQQNGRGFYETAQDVDAKTRVKTYDVQNSTSYDFGALTLRNIVGYRKTKFSDLNDIDGSAARILQIDNHYDGEQFSNELQLSGRSSILNWITGLYYFRETGSNDTTSYTGSPVLDNFINPRLQQFDVKNISKSVYAQGTFDLASLTPGLTFTAGARYTWDERDAHLRSTQAVGVAPGTPTLLGFPSPGERCLGLPADGFGAYPDCSVSLSTDFSKLSYNLSLEYKPSSGVLFYLATRQGYRSGGFNARAQLAYQLTPFRPEVVRDVEGGIKADWRIGDAPVRTNLSLFYSDFKDAQRLAPNLIGGVVTTDVVNAAKAHVQGGELEFSIIPVSALTLGGFISYTDAAYDDYVVPGPGGVGTRDLSATARFAQTPKLTYSLNARLNLPTPDRFGALSVSATYYHQSDVYVTDNTEPAGRINGWGTLGLRADLEHIGGAPVDLGVFVRNVTDEKYNVAGQTLNNDIGFASRIPGAPRTVGVSLRYSFGG